MMCRNLCFSNRYHTWSVVTCFLMHPVFTWPNSVDIFHSDVVILLKVSATSMRCIHIQSVFSLFHQPSSVELIRVGSGPSEGNLCSSWNGFVCMLDAFHVSKPTVSLLSTGGSSKHQLENITHYSIHQLINAWAY